MRWTDEVDTVTVAVVALYVAFGLYCALIVGIIEPRREAQQCHRFYSAAATARDSLWVATLRPECQVTP